jgi:beta-mannosidase
MPHLSPERYHAAGCGTVAAALPPRPDTGTLRGMRALLFLAGLAVLVRLAASERLDLAGTWALTLPAEPQFAAVPLAVPGDVHSALLAAGRIPDPYWGDHERVVQWVGMKDWLAVRTFDAPASLRARRLVTLRLEDVDTFCDLTLNGELIGACGNRFRRYDIDVTGKLKPTGNVLAARFRSAELEASARAQRLPWPIPHSMYPGSKRHVNLIRKPACHGGWDWGPALMAVGFAGPVQLLGDDTARIDYVHSAQRHAPTGCTVTVTVDCTAPAAAAGVPLTVALGAVRVERRVDLVAGANRFAVPVVLAAPRLWWPAGLGEPYLHPLRVTLADSEHRHRIGLRTIEVDTTPDAAGSAFALRVNGVSVFAKGANWIPSDALPQRQTPARAAGLLDAAVAANMNCLRVWGGGQFEPDWFYDLADERGLLLWHDLMFACALYPADDGFLGEVQAELAHQLRRLKDHASIALWCGDNECTQALGWFEESRKNRDRYLVMQDRLRRVQAAAVAEHDPQRFYWPSSPSAGPDEFGDKDEGRGDRHIWDVWHRNQDFSAYQAMQPRFASEFGFQSLPSLALARTFAPDDQLNPSAPLFEHHQKNPGGNGRILDTMARYFRMPAGYAHTAYLSQVQQALAIETALDAWRRLRPRCQGALFWQLNDVWPVASWSAVEYDGAWKPLMHHAARAFAPLAVAAVPALDDPGRIEVWGINDRLDPLAARVAVELWDVDGTLLETQVQHVRLPANGVLRALALPAERAGDEAQRERRFLAITIGATLPDGRAVTQRALHAFARWKRMPLVPATVRAEPRRDGDAWRVRLTTDRPAFHVWLASAVPGRFDDNSLHLLPGRPVEVTFLPARPGADYAAFAAALTATHLRQTY